METSHFALTQGARAVWWACTHAGLTRQAIERIESSPVSRFVVTHTMARSWQDLTTPDVRDTMTVLPVGPLLADAISRIHDDRRPVPWNT
jgi:ribose-phosphate pyrophosphokinase